MPRKASLLFFLLSALLVPGCVSYGALEPDGSDSGKDAGQDGAAQEDDAPVGPCAGPAYVRRGGERHSPVPVTTDWLIMDCCEGVYL